MPRCPHVDTDQFTRYYEYEAHGKRRYCQLCISHKRHGKPLFPPEYEKAVKQLHPYEHDTDRTCTPEQLRTIPQMSDLQWKMHWHSRQRDRNLRDWRAWLFELPPPPNPHPVLPTSVEHHIAHSGENYLDYIFH